ncbi:MAG: asparagine--tRNA ligase [Meiothermus sp.]|uniref:asparagine--tRNA ligase n=1 Tax=Meiothermus sp. TaxID=1955249 RepID=UPI0025D6FDD2|nr:asparagine--tRNA ligase [Meiothermus sp.]MCS7058095.1 asparagine--tRNA ligase [Meiothermus sp.]MCS7193489.1 asparagine--tRNA ligase [Meiothermus sp.]MCX7741501.1 asparagine--tRNA ligase [Meiothermus sp.]MDW8090109.1 asparagine--tRNA ligase [Meiothermus sp.]MDW8481413.1 asparagine--tRNA ligase [Meiothermus sp.]
MQRVFIEEIARHEGQVVLLRGWLTNRRSKGKIHFLQLRDGTGFIQATALKGELPEAQFEEADHLPQETALEVWGVVRADRRAPGGYELAVQGLRVIARPSREYPITPKEHGVEFLMDHRHLHLRHRRAWAALRVRDELERAIHDFFHARGFIRLDAPILTPNAVEGTTDLFEVDLFDGEKAYLSQSGQLYAEAGAMAFGKVYTFGPTFRAERSKTRRHLLEFWMVEPEVAFMTHEENLRLQEELVAYLVGRVLEERRLELEMLERDTKPLEATAQGGFPRITYTEAIERVNRVAAEKPELGLSPLAWGEDFGAPHEAALSQQFDRPVFVEKYPAAIKAFYMQPDPDDPRVVLNADLLAHEGVGEIIGGSERIHDPELLRQKIREHHLPEEVFDWYMDLRLFGSVPHAGFGLGLERTVRWICGLEHIREAIPFPRMYTRMRP